MYEKSYFSEEALLLEAPSLQKFVSILPPKARVLDVGCGVGIDAQYFLDKDVTYTGIDASPRMISIAKSRNPRIEFEVMDMRHLHYGDSCFDGLMSLESIIHFPKKDLSSLLSEFARVIKKDGAILLSVEMGHGEKVVEFGLGLKEEIIVSLYSLKEINRALENLGFHIIFHSKRKPVQDEFPFTKLSIVAKRSSI